MVVAQEQENKRQIQQRVATELNKYTEVDHKCETDLEEGARRVITERRVQLQVLINDGERVRKALVNTRVHPLAERERESRRQKAMTGATNIKVARQGEKVFAELKKMRQIVDYIRWRRGRVHRADQLTKKVNNLERENRRVLAEEIQKQSALTSEEIARGERLRVRLGGEEKIVKDFKKKQLKKQKELAKIESEKMKLAEEQELKKKKDEQEQERKDEVERQLAVIASAVAEMNLLANQLPMSPIQQSMSPVNSRDESLLGEIPVEMKISQVEKDLIEFSD